MGNQRQGASTAGVVSGEVKRKQNTIVLIDGENISHKKAEAIIQVAKSQGVPFKIKVYGRQKDPCTKGWSNKAKALGIEDIRLYGIPTKDKVDKKMQKDAGKAIQQCRNLDIICFATSDSGFTNTIEELRSKGKRVIGIGEEKASYALRSVCSRFFEV